MDVADTASMIEGWTKVESADEVTEQTPITPTDVPPEEEIEDEDYEEDVYEDEEEEEDEEEDDEEYDDETGSTIDDEGNNLSLQRCIRC